MKKILHTKKALIITVCLVLQLPVAYSADYYWVGGSGDWSDLTHWATASGGSPNQVQIPTAQDNVFFDANSFSSPGSIVNINANPALCKNMDWTGAKFTPTLSGVSTNSIKIFGSLTFISQMNLTFSGTVNFEAISPGMTITSAGHQFPNTVNFNGAGGQWTLQDKFSVKNLLAIYFGTLITNNMEVTAGAFKSSGTKTRSLVLGSSLFTITDSSSSAFFADFINFTLNAGTSTIRFSYNGSTPTGISCSQANTNATFYNVEFTGTNPEESIINTSGYALSFNNVTFKSHGYISGNNTFNGILSLTAGRGYIFEMGSTQTINGSITSNGDCIDFVTIESSDYISNASFYRASGSVNVDHFLIENIHATGGATWTATNSIKIYNATGWNSTNPPNYGADYYWIGGNGNWSDPSHWSLSSGGPPNAAGCIPQCVNNVFFDSKSFNGSGQSVNIDLLVASCNSMDWTGASLSPSLTGISSNNIKIFGSLKFIPGMNLAFNGFVLFEAKTMGKTITSAGKIFLNQVEFCGDGGGWTFLDDFNCNVTLFHVLGNLNTNNKAVTINKFKSDVNYTRTLTLGSSLVTIMDGNSNAFLAVFTNYTFNSGTSKIRFTNNTITVGLMSNTAPGNVVFYDVEFINPASCGNITNSTGKIFVFHNMYFAGNGIVLGDNSYNGTLTLTAGKCYSFESGFTQTITGNLSANGTCGNTIIIQSTINGSAAKFTKPTGAINVSYLLLKDNNAQGGAAWNAAGSVILSNTTGWNITPPSNGGINYYWIGGTGNWSDPMHWSLSSGGPPNIGGCIPGYSNNVYFDANSFSGANQTVTVDVNPALCNDMVWTGALYMPTFAGSSVTSLNIYGSLTFINAMKLTFTGQTFFEATSLNKTVRTGGMKFLNFVSFNGAGGSWIIQDSLTSSSKVNLFYGTLNTNSKPVTTGTFYSNTTTTRGLILGSSIFTITGASNTALHLDFTNLSFNAGNSTFRFTYHLPVYVGMTLVAANSNVTFYNVEFTNSSAFGFIYNKTGKNAIFNNVTFKGHARNDGDNIFNDVIIFGDGVINGTNTFHDLTFTAGQTYTLQSTLIQTIINNWWIQGICNKYIMLYSSINGNPAFVSKAAGTVNGFLIHIRDIHCIGGATFYAYNSVDLGGLNGWTFGALPFMATLTNIAGVSSACEGNNTYTYYVPSTGALSYFWTVPATAMITGGQNDTIITVTFPGPTSGNISVYAFNGCGYSPPVVLPVTINPNPVANAGIDQTICKGTNAALTATGGGTYKWSTNATTQTITVTPATTTAYVVTVTTPATGCSALDSVLVNVAPVPALTISPAQTICIGDSVTLTAGGGTTYLWSNNATTAAITVSPTVSTTYKVTATTGNCTATDDVVVTVNPPLFANAGIDQTICKGTSATLTATGGGTYKWSTNATTQTITVTPSVTTTYGVTVTSFGCTTSDNVTVNVKPTPVANAGPDKTICNGQSANLNASGGTAYLWSPQNSLSASNIPNPVAIPTSTTTYTVTVSDTSGCSGTDNILVSVTALPLANAGSDISICIGDSATLTATGGTSYLWSSGGNTASVTVTPTITSTYIVTVTKNSCSASDSLIITVNPSIHANTGNDTTICPGQKAILTTTGFGSFLWSNNDTTQTITVTPAVNTTYSVTVTDNGCTTSDAVNVNLFPLPNANAGNDQPVCPGQSANLSASAGAGLAYLWSPANSLSNPNIINPVATPSSTTIYTLSVTDAIGCTATDQVTITVASTPPADAGNDTNICFGEYAYLLASGGTSYLWNTGAASANLTVNPPVMTTYYVTVSIGNCSAADSVTVTVSPVVHANAGNDTTICPGQNAVLTTAGFGSFLWSNNDTTRTITVSPSANTTYTVTVTDNGCTTSDAVNVNLYPLPNANAGTDQSICPGQSATLSGSGGNSCLWSPAGTLSNPNIYNPVATPGSTTIYTINVTDAIGCTASDQVTVTVAPMPVANAGNDTNICFGEYAYLLASGGTGYLWNTGAASANLTVNPPVMTTYYVTVSLGNCSAADSVTVTVSPVVHANAGSDTTICPGQNAVLTTAGFGSFLWSNNDTTRTITVTPSVNTTYSVTVTDNGCSTSDAVNVNLYPLPGANAGTDQTICTGQSANLSASGGNTFLWSPANDLNNPNIFDPIATPADSTIYTVTVTDINGCTASDQVLVNVVQYPIADAGRDTVICSGSNFILNASGGVSYQWSNGSSGDSVTVAPLASTTYIVTVSNGYCASTDNITLTVFPLPTLAFTSDVFSGCAPLTVNFLNYSAPQTLSYYWQFGDSAVSDTSSPVHVYSSEGTYDVSLTATDTNGCQNSITINQMITVNPSPVIDFTWNPYSPNTSNSTVNFIPSDNSLSAWNWNFGDTNSAFNYSDISDPSHYFLLAGTYNVVLWVQNQYGCTDTISHVVTVKEVTNVWVPNAFTPDKDGMNDIFIPVFSQRVLEKYEFMIFDRWGELMFRTNNIDEGWNGKQRGGVKPAPGNVYVWKISYKADSERAKDLIGRVTLVR